MKTFWTVVLTLLVLLLGWAGFILFDRELTNYELRNCDKYQDCEQVRLHLEKIQ